MTKSSLGRINRRRTIFNDQYVVTYCDCLEGIKWRISAIDSILSGKTLGNKMIDEEFIALQLRKSLEMIAFSSLAANKNVYEKQYKDFMNHWNAKFLMRDLEKVNPGFYPKPIKSVSVNEETKIKHVEIHDKGFLTKDDFVELYELCGGILHSRNPFKSNNSRKDFISNMSKWVHQIKFLLKEHVVSFIDSDKHWIVVMNDPPDGTVKAYILEPDSTKRA